MKNKSPPRIYVIKVRKINNNYLKKIKK